MNKNEPTGRGYGGRCHDPLEDGVDIFPKTVMAAMVFFGFVMMGLIFIVLVGLAKWLWFGGA